MKIHDLVDVSRAATQHLRATGDISVLPFNGTIPMTRATLIEEQGAQTQTGMSVVSFPEWGGLRLKHMHRLRSTTTVVSGLYYNFDFIERGLTERNTQLNFSWTQTYASAPPTTVYMPATWTDCAFVMRTKTGQYAYYAMAAAKTVLADLSTPMKRELVIDRQKKLISLYSRHPKTGAVTKNTYNYSSQVFGSGMELVGVMFGMYGGSASLSSNSFNYPFEFEMLYENILFTENDLPTDPARHGPFDLATFANVVQSSHPNAAVLNATRTIPVVSADRYQGKPSVAINKDTPLTLTLRPTLLSDSAAQNKGKCLAVLVTGDIKNTSGPRGCKAQVQDGRLARFATPRTHPYQQSIGMPGIDATFAQLDLRRADGDLDTSVLNKSITLSVN